MILAKKILHSKFLNFPLILISLFHNVFDVPEAAAKGLKRCSTGF